MYELVRVTSPLPANGDPDELRNDDEELEGVRRGVSGRAETDVAILLLPQVEPAPQLTEELELKTLVVVCAPAVPVWTSVAVVVSPKHCWPRATRAQTSAPAIQTRRMLEV